MQQQNQDHLFGELSFDATAKQHIRSMASWAMTVVTVAVIGYIISLVDLFMYREVAVSTRSEGFDFSFGLTGSNMITSIIAVLVGLLINYFLFRFASQAKSGLDGLNQAQLNSSFNNLKTYFMIISVFLIIVFVLVLLVFVFALTRAAA